MAPKSSGKADYIGAFAVTGGLEEDTLADMYEAQHDDYNKIMVKALSDRLAEAFAEYLHEKVRKVHWGYAANENLSNEELIRETIKEYALRRAILPALNILKKQQFGRYSTQKIALA